MKITGMGNFEEYNYLIVEKKEGFFEWFNELLNNAFPDFYSQIAYDSLKERNVKEYMDVHDFFDCQGIRINVFYGMKKSFIDFNCDESKRKHVMEVLKEISEFGE